MYAVRHARAADLRHLAAVEESTLPLMEGLFGDLTGDALAGPAASGSARAGEPGFLLVLARAGEPPVGFAHVLVLDGHAHLEQLSVHTDRLREGLGSALVRAAMAEAGADGHAALSLCTYRDVAFNGPFYAGLGFTEVERPLPFQVALRDHERRRGLDRHGVRVVMSAPLGRGRVRPGP